MASWGNVRGRRKGVGLRELLTAVIWNSPELLDDQGSIEDVINFTTPQELYTQSHGYVTNFLKSSAIHKLGELAVQDSVALTKLGDKTLMTLGSNDPKFDWKGAWEEVLEMGHHASSKSGSWSNEVTVEAWVLTVKNAIAPDHEGLLYPILKGYQSGGVSLSMFGLPSLQAVLDWKWKTFTRTFVYIELFLLLSWIICFTTLGLLMSGPGSLTPVGIWADVANVCNVVSFAAMLPFLLIELANAFDHQLAWMNMWNLTNFCSCVLQGMFFVVHCRSDLDESWVSSLLAMQNLLLWLRLFWLCRALQTSKTVSLVDILAIVCMEIRDFILLCAMLIWAFAFSFHVLFRMDSVSTFRYVGESVMNVLKWMKSGSDMGIVSQVKSHELVTCMLLVLFQIVMAMMMMSLLIGVVNRSVAKAGVDQELKAYAAQAVITIDLETTLPSFIENAFPRKWYPKYLHVLRIKPDSLAVVDSKYTWQSSRAVTQQANAAQAANTPANGNGNGPAAAGTVAAADLAGLNQQLKELQGALHSQTLMVQKLLDKPNAPMDSEGNGAVAADMAPLN